MTSVSKHRVPSSERRIERKQLLDDGRLSNVEEKAPKAWMDSSGPRSGSDQPSVRNVLATSVGVVYN